MNRALLFVLSLTALPSFALSLMLPSCGSTPPTPEVVRAPAPTDQDLVRGAMPAIVLVVNAREDNKTSYGAGFFDAQGRVLTAQHVIADKGQVSVMLFREGRATYSPMDGGIMRFLFEYSRDLVPANVAKVDAVSDLAMLELAQDVGPRPALRWAESSVHPGDRVFALGHPQETPWSFSAGVVGALQYGLIQHDATVGPGSSGGPLLNVRGEVVGMNVAQVVSEPVGLSFARPAHVVTSALGEGSAATTVDLSSATTSALSCWRAQELALREVANCFDWETDWRQYQTLVEEAARHLDDDARARLLSCGKDGDTKSQWISRRREKVTRALDPTFKKDEKENEIDPNDPDLPPEVAQLLRDGLAEWKKIEVQSGSFESDFHDVAKLRTRLRQGLRIEDARRVTPDLEWVLLGSKNADGSVAHFSELYVRIGPQPGLSATGEIWVQRGAPWPDEVRRLPQGWPPPMESFAMKRSFSLAYLIKRAKQGEVCGGKIGQTTSG